jgi:predicted acylesterase/phospholipase RssA
MPGYIERIRSDRSLDRYSPKMVYVLSGGAASGLCHLGMIEALEKRGIRPDFIIGTSAGALFGALYCHFGNIEDVFRQVEIVLASDEFEEFERKSCRNTEERYASGQGNGHLGHGRGEGRCVHFRQNF